LLGACLGPHVKDDASQPKDDQRSHVAQELQKTYTEKKVSLEFRKTKCATEQFCGVGCAKGTKVGSLTSRSMVRSTKPMPTKATVPAVPSRSNKGITRAKWIWRGTRCLFS
jgi:hypothetical protein